MMRPQIRVILDQLLKDVTRTLLRLAEWSAKVIGIGLPIALRLIPLTILVEVRIERSNHA